jgi:hypothetical protein
MPKNPYKYTGPLDPVEDRSVCISRSKETNKVIEGILQGDYWTILGPTQIGKTTFLLYIKQELKNYKCIYLDFQVSPSNEAEFYNRVINIICEELGEKPQTDIFERGELSGYDVVFYDLMRSLVSKTDKKIILLFDEIEDIPSIKTFLKIWRKVYHERYQRPELKRLALVVVGTAELIPLTIGPTSPFNIARKLYLSNLTAKESEQLIVKPLKNLQIDIAQEAVQKIIDQTSGHPQLLQHTCHLLVEQTPEEGRNISEVDVEYTIETLFHQNDNLITLVQQLDGDKTLKYLIKRVITGEEVRYLSHEKYSLSGVGPIIENNHFCAIRSKLYEKFIGERTTNDIPLSKYVKKEKSDDHLKRISKNMFKKFAVTFTTLSAIFTIISAITKTPIGLMLGVFFVIIAIISSLIYGSKSRRDINKYEKKEKDNGN